MKAKILTMFGVLALVLTFSFMFTINTYASEDETETTETTETEETTESEETTETTETEETTTEESEETEEDTTEALIEAVKEALKEKLNDYANVLIAGGLTGAVAILGLIITLATQFYKLRKAQIESKEAKTEAEQNAKKRELEMLESYNAEISKLKDYVSAMFGNLTDEQKTQISENAKEISTLLDEIKEENK